MPKRDEAFTPEEGERQRSESTRMESLTDLIDTLQRQSFCRRFEQAPPRRFERQRAFSGAKD